VVYNPHRENLKKLSKLYYLSYNKRPFLRFLFRLRPDFITGKNFLSKVSRLASVETTGDELRVELKTERNDRVEDSEYRADGFAVAVL
jgi:hypothetical protein